MCSTGTQLVYEVSFGGLLIVRGISFLFHSAFLLHEHMFKQPYLKCLKISVVPLQVPIFFHRNTYLSYRDLQLDWGLQVTEIFQGVCLMYQYLMNEGHQADSHSLHSTEVFKK